MDRLGEPLTGVILAGGRGKRLGRDKSRLTLGGGENLLTRTINLMSHLLPRVTVVGRETVEAEYFLDDRPGSGPVGAVTTALHQIKTACLVLPCDLPFMDEPTLTALIEGWRQRPAGTLLTTFVNWETGYRESLISIYEPGALTYFESCLARDLLKITLVVPEVYHHLISYSSDEALPFFSINHPADYLVAELLLNKK